MPVQLKNPAGPFPRDGFEFWDPHTAKHFPNEGLDKHQQALLVAEHRKANPKIYPEDNPAHFDIATIEQEIVVQICARHPEFCEDSATPGQPYPAPPAPPSQSYVHPSGRTCERCGSDQFTPVVCMSCGGGKINGYRCVKCGTEISR